MRFYLYYNIQDTVILLHLVPFISKRQHETIGDALRHAYGLFGEHSDNTRPVAILARPFDLPIAVTLRTSMLLVISRILSEAVTVAQVADEGRLSKFVAISLACGARNEPLKFDLLCCALDCLDEVDLERGLDVLFKLFELSFFLSVDFGVRYCLPETLVLCQDFFHWFCSAGSYFKAEF